VFLPGGGSQTDASVRFEWQPRPNMLIKTFVQRERWLIPALSPTPQRNITGQIQVTYTPHWRIFKQ